MINRDYTQQPTRDTHEPQMINRGYTQQPTRDTHEPQMINRHLVLRVTFANDASVAKEK